MTPALREHAPPERPRDSIALVTRDVRRLGPLPRMLRPSVGEVALADSLSAIGDYSAFALVAVHYDTLSPAEQAELVTASLATPRPRLLILSDGRAQRDYPSLFGSHALTNLLVLRDAGTDTTDLLVTLNKIKRQEIFGLEKYFAWGIDPRTARITSSTEKEPLIEAISGYAEGFGVAPRLRAAIRVVADEFIANAIYNSPVDVHGNPRYATRARTRAVRLDPAEAIEVRYCCDGRRFGLSTCDPFGSLTATKLQDHLATGFRRGRDQVRVGPGGAGIGFYTILDSLSHFVVNIAAGERTELVGLLDVSGGYRCFADAGKSFNIFEKDRIP